MKLHFGYGVREIAPPPPSNSFENTSHQLGLGLDSCIVFQMAICISFYSTIFQVRIWPMQCSLGNLNTIRPPPVAAIDFDSLRMCESWGSNKLSFLISQGSFSWDELSLRLLPHSAPTWILNPSWALMRARVGSKIRFDQPTTHPPTRLLNLNVPLHIGTDIIGRDRHNRWGQTY